MTNKKNVPIALVLLAAGLLTGGCSTIENNHRQKAVMMSAWVSGDVATARQTMDRKLAPRCWWLFWWPWDSCKGTGDELVWRLDSGTIAFTTGMYDDAIQEFKTCEEIISEYDERATVSARDVGSEVGSALTNPNSIPYRGWCRDRMGVEIFKSLAYLGAGREESFRAQVKRLRQRQKDIQEDYRKYFEKENEELAKAKDENAGAAKKASEVGSESYLVSKSEAYKQSLADMRKVAHKGYGTFLNPLGLYLSALGNIRDGNWDNAKIDTQRLHEALPSDSFVSALHAETLRNAGRAVPADLAGIASQINYPMDRDCVYVIFANGHGAALEHQTLDTDAIKFAWPKCRFYPAQYRHAFVTGGGRSTSTHTLADMDAILAEEFNERLPGIIARTVISTLVKEGAYRGGQVAAFAANNDWRVEVMTYLAVTVVGGIYREATNTADTRSWETMPKEFQVSQIPMPADRKLNVKLVGMNGVYDNSFNVNMPATSRSAILYISAPSPTNVRYMVLPFTSK